jgi:hypothetical protein
MKRPDPKMAFTDTHKYNKLYAKWEAFEGRRRMEAEGYRLVEKFAPTQRFFTKEELADLLSNVWHDGKYD